MKQEKTIIHINTADSRTGFAIGGKIGQFVIITESLSLMTGADTTGDVHLLRNNIVPNPVDGLDVRAISRNGSHVCHARIHINSAYGMPHSFILLDDRFMRLAISIFPASVSACIQKEFSLIEVFTVARH